MTTTFKLRAKVTASVDTNGDLLFGGAVEGFNGMPTEGAFYYVAESGTDWEFGRYDPGADAGSRREILEWGGEEAFANGTTGLTVFTTPGPRNFVSSGGGTGADPRARGDGATAVGTAADAYLAGATAVGARTNVQGPSATAVGADTSVVDHDVGHNTALGAKANAGHPSATAVGARSKTSCAGETVLGSTEASHVAHIPLLTEADLTAGGTFTLQAVADQSGPGGETLASLSYMPEPSSNAYCAYAQRVRLSLFARGYVDPDNVRVFATAEYLVLEATVTTTTAPTIVTEAPASSGVSFAVNSSGIPTVTVPVGFEGKVAGLMVIERVAVPA